MNDTLKNHPIWDELNRILAQIDVKSLVMEHLRSSSYKVKGYWDEDAFYDEIIFVSPLRAELVNSSIGQTQIKDQPHCWLRLQFVLIPDVSDSETDATHDDEEICELTLVLDSDGRIIDENWLIDVEPPFVIARKKP